MMDVRFHCSKRVRHSGKKSKHRVMEACETVQKVLRLNPDYGVSLSGFPLLRKMRVKVPSLNVGKSGGYRLIYREMEMDEAIHVVLLETYFKGDSEDLSHGEYETLIIEAEAILSQPITHDWD